MAYVVEDIHAAMKPWAEELKVGPWFLLEHFTGVEAFYRGQPSEAEMAIAMSFAGHMMIELISRIITRLRCIGKRTRTGFYRATLGWDGKNPIRPFA